MRKIKLKTTKGQSLKLTVIEKPENPSQIESLGNEILSTKTFNSPNEIFTYIYALMWRVTYEKEDEFVSEEVEAVCLALLEYLLWELGLVITKSDGDFYAYSPKDKKLYNVVWIIKIMTQGSDDYSFYTYDLTDEESAN